MRRRFSRLTDREVRAKREPGHFLDGGGLYLQVTQQLTKSWLFCYSLNGRSREMGLGPLHTVSLAQARESAQRQRTNLLEGIDPIDARDSARKAAALEKAKEVSFADCAQRYIDGHRAKWKNAKHADQWENTLETYAAPAIGRLPVQHIDTAAVLRILEPIWAGKPETASRLRSRIAL